MLPPKKSYPLHIICVVKLETVHPRELPQWAVQFVAGLLQMEIMGYVHDSPIIDWGRTI